MPEQTNETTAELATLRGELNLRELTLLGTFGPEHSPAALLRTSAGRIRRVSPGDRLMHQRVVAIGDGHLVLANGVETRRLVMPTARLTG